MRAVSRPVPRSLHCDDADCGERRLAEPTAVRKPRQTSEVRSRPLLRPMPLRSVVISEICGMRVIFFCCLCGFEICCYHYFMGILHLQSCSFDLWTPLPWLAYFTRFVDEDFISSYSQPSVEDGLINMHARSR